MLVDKLRPQCQCIFNGGLWGARNEGESELRGLTESAMGRMRPRAVLEGR